MANNNHRILLYLLSTIDDVVRVATGLRGNPHLYNQMKQSLNENSKIDPSKMKIPRPLSEIDLKTDITPKIVMDDIALVAEGIRQYTNFVAKSSLEKPLLSSATQVPPRKSLMDYPMPEFKIPDSIIPPEISKKDEKEIPEYIPTNRIIKQRTGSDFKPKKTLNEVKQMKLSEKSKERKVPANRFSRVLSFGSLAVSMGFGAAEELAKRFVGASESKTDGSLLGSNLFLNKSNAMKIVDTLCQVRGAALKLGQMLSIQDNEMLGPELQSIFERVRQSADYMPESQLIGMMSQELGHNWQTLYKKFDMKPFAAASIGQVHKAQLLDDSLVAVKVQYPGVAESIESDIKNVLSIVKYAKIFPEGLFIDHIMNYAKKELSWEVDYVREAQCQIKYGNYIKEYSYPEENLKVPIVYEDLSRRRILTTELITGIPVDKLEDFEETSNPEVKNRVIERILRLFFRELFVFNYMQTDPNWSNFFYDYSTDTLSLIDFGNCRPFPDEFVEKYREIIDAAIKNDREAILVKSEEIGFLSGFETEIFKNAHVDSVLIVGEALRTSELFDFGRQSVVKRINNQLPILLKHRLKPPPEEIYSLHRKLSGLFLLCCKLKTQINCREIFDDVVRQAKSIK